MLGGGRSRVSDGDFEGLGAFDGGDAGDLAFRRIEGEAFRKLAAGDFPFHKRSNTTGGFELGAIEFAGGGFGEFRRHGERERLRGPVDGSSPQTFFVPS